MRAGLRAGRLTAILIATGLAFAVLTAAADRTADGIIIACCVFLLCAGLALFPMSLMAPSMTVPTGFATVLWMVAAAVGVFSLSLPVPLGRSHRAALPALLGTSTLDDHGLARWASIATIAVMAAIVIFLVALLLLMRIRREPGWQPSRWRPIGFFAEGLRRRSSGPTDGPPGMDETERRP